MNKLAPNPPPTEEEKEKARIQMLAMRIQLLIGFAAELVPDMDLLERTVKGTSERSMRVLSVAPILGAMGEDYEEKHMQSEVQRKRSKALLNFIKTIDETETERIEFFKSKGNKAEAARELNKMLGL